jgi:hypothetical protein
MVFFISARLHRIVLLDMFDVARANAAEPNDLWFKEGGQSCPDRFAYSYSPRRGKSVAGAGSEVPVSSGERRGRLRAILLTEFLLWPSKVLLTAVELNMRIECGEAFDYFGADLRKWCGVVGFQRVETILLHGAHSAVVANR